MGIVGFNFTKIHIEKKANPSGKIDIKNNVAVTNVEKTQMSLGTAKQNGIKFNFEFTSNYEPKVGEIIFTGEILYLADEKKNEAIIKQWQKEKKVSKETMNELLKTVLMRCNVEAMMLSRDINLPPPIPFSVPKIQ